MNILLEWMRGIVLLFFVLSALLYFVPREVYKKYIRFFMEMVLVLAIIFPILKLVSKEDFFENMVHYDEFWQQMENMKLDVSHMEYTENAYYVEACEQTVEDDVSNLIKTHGYEVESAKVDLSDDYEIEQMTIDISQKEIDDATLVSIQNEDKDETLEAMKQEIVDFYQIKDEQLQVNLE